MKLHPNHLVAVATLVVIAALTELSSAPPADAAAASSDPSVPAASAVFRASDAREGNVQDLTY